MSVFVVCLSMRFFFCFCLFFMKRIDVFLVWLNKGSLGSVVVDVV